MSFISKKSVLAKAAALAMCSAAVVSVATEANARPRHHRAAAVAAQSAGGFGSGDLAANIYAGPNGTASGANGIADVSSPSVRTRRGRAAAVQAQDASGTASFGSFGLVSTARSYLGTNPTGRGSLWCGAFMDLVLKKTGHAGGGNLAKAYASYGTRLSGPQVGAIAVMGRKGGGHVGVVSGIDANGNPIIISGNHNRTVAESTYPRGRITAYVMPN